MGKNYGLFDINDKDSLIKTVKLLEKFGFRSSVVAETLDLKTYNGSVITFRPAVGGKPLSYEDALAAFQEYMHPHQLSASDGVAIKNTAIAVNEGGTMINQSYDVLYSGQRIQGSQPFQIPPGGLALTIVKVDDSKLLVIPTTP